MVNLKVVQPTHLWYIVGLIASDGNLSKDGRHIYLTSKDADLLVAVKSALHLNNQLGIKSRSSQQEKKYSILQFSDVTFYRFLVSAGLHPNKSLTLKSVHVPKKYFRDFVRGVIDGDGTINTWVHATNKHSQWCLRIVSGAPVFANWMRQEMQNHYSVAGKIYAYTFKGKKNPLSIIKFGKIATKIILKTTYYQNCLSLQRKLIKVQECLKTKDGWKTYGEMISDARVS